MKTKTLRYTLRSGVQASWTYATEVRCQNELSDIGYVKDYNAVVRFGSNGSETRFALEYERTPKAAHYYEELAKSLAQERLVRCVLYLIPSCHLLNYVSRHFARSAGRACFGLTRDWQSSPTDTPVTTPGSYARRPFLEFLCQQPGSADLFFKSAAFRFSEKQAFCLHFCLWIKSYCPSGLFNRLPRVSWLRLSLVCAQPARCLP